MEKLFLNMNKTAFLRYPITVFFYCLFALGCEKVEQIDNSTEVTVNDPEGTVTVGLDAGGTTKIANDIYINDAFNITGGSSTYLVDLGSIKSLSNISQIPANEWTNSAPAIKNHGYVVYSGKNKQFYRVYLSTELPNSNGFYAKYQGPFYGRDAAIELSTSPINSTSEGLSETYTFSNNDIIIPKSVKSSKDWCSVSLTSTNKFSFLINAVQVKIASTLGDQNEEASIEICTNYDKVSTVSVKRSGSEGVLSLNETQKRVVTGDVVSLKAFFNGEEIKDSNKITWESSNPNVASVSKSGGVTALSAGNATISVTINGTSRKASCSITVYGVSIKTQSIQNITPFNGELSGRIECEAMDCINFTYARAGVLLVKQDMYDQINTYGWDVNHRSQLDIANGDSNTFIVLEARTSKIESNGEFYLWLYALAPSTTYYYRTFLTLWDGWSNHTTYYGEIKSMTTPSWNREKSYAVDLGLSVKWSPVNVANGYAGSAIDKEKVPGQGTAFAWGEAWGTFGWGSYTLKSDTYGFVGNVTFQLKTYDPKGDGTGQYDDIGSNISGTKYDHATQYWNSNWRMPTKAEWEELMTKCTWTKASSREGNGGRQMAFLVTGPNGKSIYLPVVSHWYSNTNTTADYYWTATLDASNSQNAYIFSYTRDEVKQLESVPRWGSNHIRPVTNK